MSRIRLFTLAGLLAIGLGTGCGGSSDTEGSTGADDAPAEATADATTPAGPSGGLSLDSVRKDPCLMVTQAESEQIFGEPAQPPSVGMATGTVEASCFYSVVTENLTGAQIQQAPSASVSIMFSPDRVKGGTNGKSYMANARTGVTTEPVAGLGDEAFCAESDPAFPPNQIFARDGDIVLAVAAKDCATARQFAEKALGRL